MNITSDRFHSRKAEPFCWNILVWLKRKCYMGRYSSIEVQSHNNGANVITNILDQYSKVTILSVFVEMTEQSTYQIRCGSIRCWSELLHSPFPGRFSDDPLSSHNLRQSPSLRTTSSSAMVMWPMVDQLELSAQLDTLWKEGCKQSLTHKRSEFVLSNHTSNRTQPSFWVDSFVEYKI